MNKREGRMTTRFAMNDKGKRMNFYTAHAINTVNSDYNLQFVLNGASHNQIEDKEHVKVFKFFKEVEPE